MNTNYDLPTIKADLSAGEINDEHVQWCIDTIEGLVVRLAEAKDIVERLLISAKEADDKANEAVGWVEKTLPDIECLKDFCRKFPVRKWPESAKKLYNK